MIEIASTGEFKSAWRGAYSLFNSNVPIANQPSCDGLIGIVLEENVRRSVVVDVAGGGKFKPTRNLTETRFNGDLPSIHFPLGQKSVRRILQQYICGSVGIKIGGVHDFVSARPSADNVPRISFPGRNCTAG